MEAICFIAMDGTAVVLFLISAIVAGVTGAIGADLWGMIKRRVTKPRKGQPRSKELTA
jgi:hypothetical protein